MSETTGTEPPGPSLYEHALRLHQSAPDEPLYRGGEPYPDEERRRDAPRPRMPKKRELVGVDVAAVFDGHFADERASPGDLAGRFRELYVPIYPDPHITEAALRAGAARGREAGRWLVRYGTDTDDVVVGLALLAALGTTQDVPYVRTIGLLSETFGPLAAEALERLPDGAGAAPLLWLAERVTSWGRVNTVEALCRMAGGRPEVQDWLLRKPVDGGFLNAYFAADVAEVTSLHRVVAETAVDAEIVDHTGRLLLILTFSQGMGGTLARYPHAEHVLTAHLGHLARLGPTPERREIADLLARNLGEEEGDRGSIGPADRWRAHREGYLALLSRAEWREPETAYGET